MHSPPAALTESADYRHLDAPALTFKASGH